MAPENKEQVEDQAGAAPANPWEAAFAALDQEKAEAAPTDTDKPDEDVQDTERADAGQVAPGAETDDGATVPDAIGGPSDLGGADGGEDAGAEDSVFRFTEEEAKAYQDELNQRIQNQTIKDVAAAYIKQGVRNTNGRLGATINDPDICKRDADGVPRFYNPETGREFTGDNPRRQAQEWVDDYNRYLAQNFNQTCADYAQKLLDEQGAGLKVIEFAPKYEKLDPVRRTMFEEIIAGYEVYDGDTLIGYSCDLDKALDAVNRQVSRMQERFKGQAQQTPAEPAKPAGPALDMKSSANAGGDEKPPEFKSVAEAMEYQQDQLLKKMREGK